MGVVSWSLLFPCLVGTVFLATVLVVVLAIARNTHSPDRTASDEPDRSPLERAREAVEALSPYDRERLRRWLESRWPSGHHDDHSEGIKS